MQQFQSGSVRLKINEDMTNATALFNKLCIDYETNIRMFQAEVQQLRAYMKEHGLEKDFQKELDKAKDDARK